MQSLFEIVTDNVALKWRSSAHFRKFKGDAGKIGILRITSTRNSLRCVRHGLPAFSSIDPQEMAGPVLLEETDYQIFAQARPGSSVNIVHRDPLISTQLVTEDGGRIQTGIINFGSQIGRTEFAVYVDDALEFEFETEIFPSKLDYASDYERIVGDVQEILTGLALEYLRSTFRLGNTAPVPEPSQIEWLILLKQIAGNLEKALLQIAHHPTRGLTRESRSVQCHKIGRLDSAMRKRITRGGGSGEHVRTSTGYVVRTKLSESRARPTLNTPEHRWLKAQLTRIRTKLSSLRFQEAQRVSNGRFQRKSARSEQVHVELGALESLMVRLSRLEPFVEARGEPPPNFASLQLLMSPGYREAYTACLVLSLGLRIEGGPLQMSVKDLSQLYEYWCYLTLLKILSRQTCQTIPFQSLFQVQSHGLKVQLKKGQKTEVTFELPGGRSVLATYNPEFRTAIGLTAQKPDLALAFADPNWPKLQLLLDAKYRIDLSPQYVQRYQSPGPPEDAINSLHRYRDAILDSFTVGSSNSRPKRTVIQAAALFPYRENGAGEFTNSRLWSALETIGIGAIPLLPDSTHYLEAWIGDAIRRGGWGFLDNLIDHSTVEAGNEWRKAAAEFVLVGVLRGEDEQRHLDWICVNRTYYMPHRKDQPRQYIAKYVAIYSPSALRSPGAITHVAEVLGIEVLPRSEIQTPWAAQRKNEELQVLYKLGEVSQIKSPIENRGSAQKGKRFSTPRWTSNLGLRRAQLLTELMLETEPEWRLYEILRSRGVDFRIEACRPEEFTQEDPFGRAVFITRKAVARYRGNAGFCLHYLSGREEYTANAINVADSISG